jgi:hypothetical protein
VNGVTSRAVGALLACLPSAAAVHAQGQDSTPGQRNLLVMAELLPGRYDNSNQHYFDIRRQLPEQDRHRRVHTVIQRVTAPAFGEYVFLWSDETQTPKGLQRSSRVVTLAAGPGADEVTMKRYYRMTPAPITEAELGTLKPADLVRADGCDYYFKRRADHFRGRQVEKACQFDWQGQKVYGYNEMSLSPTSLWTEDLKYRVATGERITGPGSAEPYWQERARTFHCYVDVPGVGGGRDVPYRRYDDLEIHDKGGTVTFRTDEPAAREVSLRLESVTWHVLNEANGNFNRDSLVLHAHERMPDGTMRNGSYAFTDPTATRIGINLGWMLANCALVSRKDARPEM